VLPDPPCFPSSATAALRDGRTVRLDELREGDAILVGWADGTLGFDVVTPWSLADHSAEGALFLALATSANTTLRLTPTHHLPVGETCCKQLKQAKDVRVGELVWAVGRGAAEPEPHAVLSVRATSGRGLHSPLMQRGGFPVVDGVVTSFNSLPLVKLNAIAQPYLLASLCAASTSACTALPAASWLRWSVWPSTRGRRSAPLRLRASRCARRSTTLTGRWSMRAACWSSIEDARLPRHGGCRRKVQ